MDQLLCFGRAGGFRMWTDEIVLTPTTPQAVSTVMFAIGGTLSHLASWNIDSNSQSKFVASMPDATDKAYFWPECCSAMEINFDFSEALIVLGALNFSSSKRASAARACASEISLAVFSLYLSKASSAAAASLLWETMDPVVVTPAAMAAIATPISEIISQKSHQSPLWPRNRVEAAALALSIVSVIGGLLVASFGIFALRELLKRPK